MEEEFKPELDALVNYVLSIPDSHVTAVLRGFTDVPECTLEFWENRMRVDSIASWLNDQCHL
jgi:putative DNA primase/helicase